MANWRGRERIAARVNTQTFMPLVENMTVRTVDKLSALIRSKQAKLGLTVRRNSTKPSHEGDFETALTDDMREQAIL